MPIKGLHAFIIELDLRWFMRVRTVLGDIDGNNLGITLPHEHIFIDLTCLHGGMLGEGKRENPIDPYFRKYIDEPVKIDNLWVCHRDGFIIRDNLLLTDKHVAVCELMDFKSAGGRTIADLSIKPIALNPVLLKEVAQETGLNVIAGCGYYLGVSLPPSLTEREVEDIAKEFKSSIEDGIDESGVKAGIIGEIGTSEKLTHVEEKVLRAAAWAHLATKIPMNVHVCPWGKEGDRILNILEEEGVELCHVILSHMDVVLDLEYEERLARRGPYIEYDTFGEEEYVDSIGFVNPRDVERVQALRYLAEKGFIDQLLISQDVCSKMYLKTYGGPGYDHILRNVFPMMKRAGISDSDLDKLTVQNPSRALSF